MAASTPKTEALTPYSVEAPPHSTPHNAPASTTVPPPLDSNPRPINVPAVAVSTPTTTSTPAVFAPVDSPIATDFSHLKLQEAASTPNNNAQTKEQDFLTIPGSMHALHNRNEPSRISLHVRAGYNFKRNKKPSLISLRAEQ